MLAAPRVAGGFREIVAQTYRLIAARYGADANKVLAGFDREREYIGDEFNARQQKYPIERG